MNTTNTPAPNVGAENWIGCDAPMNDRLRESVEIVESRLSSEMEHEIAVWQAARDHLSCGTVTDEMVEAARPHVVQAVREGVRMSQRRDLPSDFVPLSSLIRAALEAALYEWRTNERTED